MCMTDRVDNQWEIVYISREGKACPLEEVDGDVTTLNSRQGTTLAEALPSTHLWATEDIL
jgi:hypothetical protein